MFNAYQTQVTHVIVKKTRTKTSIRYAKENDREKRERRRERERKVEGEILRGMCAHSKQSVDQE